MANRKVRKTRRNRRLSRSRSRRMKGGACPSGKKPCVPCSGTGKIISTMQAVCDVCRGGGKLSNVNPQTRAVTVIDCHRCGGGGKITRTQTNNCMSCGGSGCR